MKTNPLARAGLLFVILEPMFTRKWTAEYQGDDIEVTNGWNFKGETVVKIIFNDETILDRSYNLGDVVKLTDGTGVTQLFVRNGNEYRVRVGSAWHMCGMACRIDVNGTYLAGNKIILFGNYKTT